MEYDKQILQSLVSSFRNSKKNRGNNERISFTKLSPKKLYAAYGQHTANLTKMEEIEESVSKLEELDYVSVKRDAIYQTIESIILNDSMVDECETYLKEKYGIKPTFDIETNAKNLIDKYAFASPTCQIVCDRLQKLIDDKKQIKEDLERTENILKAVAFIENNKEFLYIREASVLIYGETKVLDPENKGSGRILEEVCRLLRSRLEKKEQEGEYLDEILEQFNILKSPKTLLIKGPAVLHINGSVIDISHLEEGISFSTSENIEKIEIKAPSFMTIENKTSYHRMNGKDFAYFYLGGYANRFQEEFIRKVYESNKEIAYYHFGDIDVNGFWIHYNLKKATGIPFKTWHMDIADLKDEKHIKSLHKLTPNDKKRIESLIQTEEYKEIATYMKAKNVKMEQETISYHICK